MLINLVEEKSNTCYWYNYLPGVPLAYFNIGGGEGGLEWFFGSEILAKSDFFWVYEKCWDFFWVTEENRGIFLGCEKRIKGYFWVC